MKKLLLIATLVMIPALSHAQTPNLTDQCNQIASDKEKEQGICECIASTIASGGKFSFEDKDEQFSPEELKTFEESTFESILNYEKGENIAGKVYNLWVTCELLAQTPDTTGTVIKMVEISICDTEVMRESMVGPGIFLSIASWVGLMEHNKTSFSIPVAKDKLDSYVTEEIDRLLKENGGDCMETLKGFVEKHYK